MSMFLQAEDGPPVEIATNTGWDKFAEAASKRKAGTELLRLVNEGISEEPAALRQDVQALGKTGLPPNLSGIAKNIIAFLDDGPELVMLSDGRELT